MIDLTIFVLAVLVVMAFIGWAFLKGVDALKTFADKLDSLTETLATGFPEVVNPTAAEERVAYWESMLDSVQRLQAGIHSPAFSNPSDPARSLELAQGVTIHDGHVILAMIVSGRHPRNIVEGMLKTIGYRDEMKLEAALSNVIEYHLNEARSAAN